MTIADKIEIKNVLKSQKCSIKVKELFIKF